MTMLVSRRDAARTLAAAAATLLAPPPAIARALAATAAATPIGDFAIAGGWYYDLETCLRTLAIGEPLRLWAEPENRFDPDAIVVERADGTKLGYVPRCANQPIAALLRDGRRVDAVIVDWLGSDAVSDGLAFKSFGTGDPRLRLMLAGGGV